ncbi:MAG: PAS domain-containing sensor histidine kinase [Anaerolineae bacterium]|jgi:PAS domain S-box-containing protein|nr:PAS domain-containing sensor histidine kinase [Anaerolineae bacterium]
MNDTNSSAPDSLGDAYLQATPDGVILLRLADGRVVSANPAAESLLGYAPGALVGQHFSDLLPPATVNSKTNLIRRLRGVGGIAEVQPLRRADGVESAFELLVTPVRRTDGDLIAMHLRDVAEREAKHRRDTDDERARTTTEVQQASQRQRDAFLSEVAHQLRTPLAIIQSSAGMLVSYHDRLTDAQRQDHLQRIQTHVRMAATLIEDLRFLGKVERGELAAHDEPTDLTDLMRRALRGLREHPHHPTFDVSMDGLPDWVVIDGVLLRALVEKLAANAVVYSPPGSTIHLALHHRPSQLTVTVSDPGIGIPTDFLPQATQLYQRGPNVGERPGSGVGLTVALACVTLMGGSLTLDSAEGRGTTASATLPSSP